MMRTEQLTSTPQAPIGLLARAASDDAFRAELQSNPAAVFARHGIQIDSTSRPSLPGKKDYELLASDAPRVWYGLFI